MLEPITIFSVFRAERSDAHNRALHRGALLRLKRLGARVGTLDGCYKGVQERSIGVVSPDMAIGEAINDIATETNQESILIISSTRAATLVYINTGATQHLGRLECVPMAEAMLHDAWTRDNKGYYHVVR